MRIQCGVCEQAEAEVMCCADEAALCIKCDKQIHEANKLASKHPRVPLARSPTDSPRCDICQEKIAYFFCLQDRALLCRACDVSVHSANALSSSHARFLVTGAMVRSSISGGGVDEECVPKDSNSPSSKLPSAVTKTEQPMDLITTWLMDDSEGSSKTTVSDEFSGEFDLDFIFDKLPENYEVPRAPSITKKLENHEVPRAPSPITKPSFKVTKPKPKRVGDDDSFLVPDLGLEMV